MYLDVVAAYASAARRSSADSLSLSSPPDEVELSSVAPGSASGSRLTATDPSVCRQQHGRYAGELTRQQVAAISTYCNMAGDHSILPGSAPPGSSLYLTCHRLLCTIMLEGWIW